VQIGRDDLVDYAQGCAVLGTGGGGDVDPSIAQTLAAFETHPPVQVVALDDLDDDVLVLPIAGWGAPTVAIEKLGSGREGDSLKDAAERWFGRPVGAIMAGEIGGGNGVLPLAWAAMLRLPLADADGMGRAFPEGPQVAMHVAGLSPSPAFLVDEHGNLVTIEPVDGDWYERLARTITVAFGGTAQGADFVMTADVARDVTVRGSVSLAMRIGRARREEGVDGVLRASGGLRLLEGKVVDVQRRTTAGFARGEVMVHGTGTDASRVARIHVQNENLIASEGDRLLAVVPDLIVLLDESTGSAIPTERVRYGQRVVVVGIPCDPLWRTEAGLAVAGPGYFGYPHAYVPVEDLARA
jgi:DUF917 family protein